MAPHFTVQLSAGHEILLAARQDPLVKLRASVVLTPVHDVVGGLSNFWEQCAAMLRIDSDLFTLVELKQLTPLARVSTICPARSTVSSVGGRRRTSSIATARLCRRGS